MEVQRDKTGPIIYTICGSFRFIPEMFHAHHVLCQRGIMSFLPDFDLTQGVPTESTPFDPEAQKLHDAKIAFTDAIYIINPGGYIGVSTFYEWKKARSLGKRIYWYAWDILKDKEAMEVTRTLLASYDKADKEFRENINEESKKWMNLYLDREEKNDG